MTTETARDATASKTIADLIEDRFGLPTEAGRSHSADGTVALILALK
jgi:hypothetical protein